MTIQILKPMCQLSLIPHLARQEADSLHPPHQLHAGPLVPLCSPQCNFFRLNLIRSCDKKITLATSHV